MQSVVPSERWTLVTEASLTASNGAWSLSASQLLPTRVRWWACHCFLPISKEWSFLLCFTNVVTLVFYSVWVRDTCLFVSKGWGIYSVSGAQKHFCLCILQGAGFVLVVFVSLGQSRFLENLPYESKILSISKFISTWPALFFLHHIFPSPKILGLGTCAQSSAPLVPANNPYWRTTYTTSTTSCWAHHHSCTIQSSTSSIMLIHLVKLIITILRSNVTCAVEFGQKLFWRMKLSKTSLASAL